MANINRWSPFEEALSLRDAMNRLFEDSFVASSATANRGNGVVGITMNVYEHENGFSVEASVPGLKPEDLDITLQDNVLTISGEFRQESPAQGTTAHLTERRYGRFSRSVALPTQVKSDAISANLEHGVLRLDIPKAEEVKPRKIAVQISGGDQSQRMIEGQGQKTREAGK
jgi:HSP20 family protein